MGTPSLPITDTQCEGSRILLVLWSDYTEFRIKNNAICFHVKYDRHKMFLISTLCSHMLCTPTALNNEPMIMKHSFPFCRCYTQLVNVTHLGSFTLVRNRVHQRSTWSANTHEQNHPYHENGTHYQSMHQQHLSFLQKSFWRNWSTR